jgi:hypothetical protein
MELYLHIAQCVLVACIESTLPTLKKGFDGYASDILKGQRGICDGRDEI